MLARGAIAFFYGYAIDGLLLSMLMKGFPILGWLGGVLAVGLGAMLAVTNPKPVAYDAYASGIFAQYLKTQGCDQVKVSLGEKFGEILQEECLRFIDNHQSGLQGLVSQQTSHQNFLIFSHYTTDLSFDKFLPMPLAKQLPAYELKTIGVLNRFFIYQQVEQRR